MTPRRPAPGSGHDRWLVSYADLVTVLFAFFVTLYAASNVDATKLTPLSASVRSALAAPKDRVVTETRSGAIPVMASSDVAERERSLDDVQQQLSRELKDVLDAHRLELTRDNRGVVMSLPEQATFPVGGAAPTDDAEALIARVAATLRSMSNPVRIEGHTDDVPIRTPRFASNWELSTARASAVVAFLIQEQGFDGQRLSAAGYGEFHPRAANDSPLNRARNRRIDLVVQAR